MGNAERVILITLKTQTQKNRLTFGKTVLIYNQMAGRTLLYRTIFIDSLAHF